MSGCLLESASFLLPVFLLRFGLAELCSVNQHPRLVAVDVEEDGHHLLAKLVGMEADFPAVLFQRVRVENSVKVKDLVRLVIVEIEHYRRKRFEIALLLEWLANYGVALERLYLDKSDFKEFVIRFLGAGLVVQFRCADKVEPYRLHRIIDGHLVGRLLQRFEFPSVQLMNDRVWNPQGVVPHFLQIYVILLEVESQSRRDDENLTSDS